MAGRSHLEEIQGDLSSKWEQQVKGSQANDEAGKFKKRDLGFQDWSG